MLCFCYYYDHHRHHSLYMSQVTYLRLKVSKSAKLQNDWTSLDQFSNFFFKYYLLYNEVNVPFWIKTMWSGIESETFLCQILWKTLHVLERVTLRSVMCKPKVYSNARHCRLYMTLHRKHSLHCKECSRKLWKTSAKSRR